MIVLDANLLIYAYDESSLHHKKARKWVEKALSGSESVAIPLQTIAAFLRIMTHRGLPAPRFTIEEAVEIVDAWFDQPNTRMITPDDDHWHLLRQVLLDGQVCGPLATDAQLAAITMEYGGTLYSTDRDFARFPGLRWKNPLASTKR